MRRILFLAAMTMLLVPITVFAQTGCYAIGEFTFSCSDPDTGCDGQQTTTYCDSSGSEYSCIFDSGSGMCCDQVYHSDLLWRSTECPPPKGPKPPQGLKNQGPLPDRGDTLNLEARLYVPACGGQYAVFELFETSGKATSRRETATAALLPKPGRAKGGLR